MEDGLMVNNKVFILILMLLVFSSFFGGTFFALFLSQGNFDIYTVESGKYYESVLLLENGTLEEYDRVGRVGCDSNSMGLTMNCGDLLYEIAVNPGDKLYKGQIYVYNQTNFNETDNSTYYELIVHRLVGCVDDDCNLTIFKGDNNHVSEMVNRTDILYRVVMAKYK